MTVGAPGKNLAVSVVIPVYNDQEVLNELYRRLSPVLNAQQPNHEIIFVDDGSIDDSVKILREIQTSDYRLKIVVLSNNFGQSNAIAAGLESCTGEIIVVMDCDLEDRPEDIPTLLEMLESSSKPLVIAQREIRNTPLAERLLSNLFFALANLITNITQPAHLGVFRAFKRSSYQKIKQDKTLQGTILSRFYQAEVPFATVQLVKDKRFAGSSGYTFGKRCKLAFDRLLPHLKNPAFRQERNPYFVVKEIIEIRETK